MSINARSETSVAILLLRTSVLMALVLGLSGIGVAHAQDHRKAAEARVVPAKAGEARTARPPARSKVATQKLMRDPWERKTLVVRNP